jgi:hypothetical protein
VRHPRCIVHNTNKNKGTLPQDDDARAAASTSVVPDATPSTARSSVLKGILACHMHHLTALYQNLPTVAAHFRGDSTAKSLKSIASTASSKCFSVASQIHLKGCASRSSNAHLDFVNAYKSVFGPGMASNTTSTTTPTASSGVVDA